MKKEKLVIVDFIERKDAEKAMEALKAAPAAEGYVVSQACVAQNIGGVIEHGPLFDTGLDTANDQTLGGIIGSLVGLIAGPLGVLAGWGAGYLLGGAKDKIDAGKNAKVIERVISRLPEGMTILIALIYEEREEETGLSTIRKNEAEAELKGFDALFGKYDVVIDRFEASEILELTEKAAKLQKRFADGAAKKGEASPNAPFSEYLNGIAPAVKQVVSALREDFDYVSVLSTDSVGFRISISQSSKSVTNRSMTTERGNVVRVCKDGLYSEYAFNEFDTADTAGMIREIKEALKAQLALLKACGSEVYETGTLEDEPIELFVEKEARQLPETTDIEELVGMMTGLSDMGMETIPGALDVMVNATSTHISKMFLTANRDMRQSYVFTEASVASYAPNEKGEIKLAYDGVSGCGGPEIISGLKAKLDKLPGIIDDLVSAGRVVPGEYDIITDPGITGLIAHEAFGHGVEMDMFVKGRALGAEYIDKRVGSDIVTMHEGAKCAENVTSYAFDDEGTLAGDVIEIDHGILRTGICDALSAVRLGTEPTGNGKRENYAHKVYTRMTNTVFDSGNSTLDEMIKSIDFGYLLSGTESGMEDPKHWGIQCIMSRGYEIKDGKLTGKVVSPVIMTGYVPDVLESVSMASTDRRVEGNGYCGKGHKELVKVADGGPYLKMRARLG